MAQLMGMDDEFEDEPTLPDVTMSRARTRIEIVRDEEAKRRRRVISYPCPNCELDRCRRCEGACCLAADVDQWTVDIDGVVYDRGIESDERIAEALASVDEECRDDLEWLLRHGPSDDVDSPAMKAVIARAESEPRAVIEPMSIMEQLAVALMTAAVEAVDPRKEERLRRLALTQLGGFTPIGGWQL